MRELFGAPTPEQIASPRGALNTPSVFFHAAASFVEDNFTKQLLTFEHFLSSDACNRDEEVTSASSAGSTASGGQRAAGAKNYANCLRRICDTQLSALTSVQHAANSASKRELKASQVALSAQARADGIADERCDRLFPTLWHVLCPYRVSLLFQVCSLIARSRSDIGS